MASLLVLLACGTSIKLDPVDTGVDTAAGRDDDTSESAADSASDSAVDSGASDTADTADGPEDACRWVGLLADASLLLEGGTAVDGYAGGPFDDASAVLASVGVNSAAPCAANVSGTVDADLWLAGDPETVVCLGYGGAVTGATATMDAPIALEGGVAPPMPATSGFLTLPYAGAATIAADSTYDSVYLGGASTLTIDGDVDLFVTGDFASGGTIALTEGSRLHLWVAGAARFDWAAQVNPSGASEQVVLDMLGEGEVTLSWDSRAVMRVVHPYGRVNLEGGTLIGNVSAREVRATWGSTFHVDMSDACAR